MDHSAPLASGRDADIFALGAHRVLRRYRDGGDVAAEAAVMRYVGEQGFPVPVVHAAERADLVMERLDGPSLLVALRSGDMAVEPAARILADLHRQLHALPPRLSSNPAIRILHLDLHPDNVMLSSRGPVLIDWRNATEGPPDLDVALSALILAQVAADTNRATTSADTEPYAAGSARSSTGSRAPSRRWRNWPARPARPAGNSPCGPVVALRGHRGCWRTVQPRLPASLTTAWWSWLIRSAAS